MKQDKLCFTTALLAACFVITNSCSQTAAGERSSVLGVFIASTPCDDASRAMLKIHSSIKCELMKWNLTLHQDPETLAPAGYKLLCEYGLPKQGTKGFMEGTRKIELMGKWAIGKGTTENANTVVYKLNSVNPQIALSFLKIDQNLLHLLDGDNRLMTGNGAWSYTFNRTNPIVATSANFAFQITSSPPLSTDSVTVGIFGGRTKCITVISELNKISSEGCQATKWLLTLYQDPQTHTPTTFRLHTIYVGKGDTRYTNTGKWIVIRGTNTDPEAFVYQLELNPGRPHESLAFLKADDNILFVLNEGRNLMVGDGDFSYTLYRVKK